MNSRQLVASQSRAYFAMCAGAPSSWFLRASVLIRRENCISLQARPKWMLHFVKTHVMLWQVKWNLI